LIVLFLLGGFLLNSSRAQDRDDLTDAILRLRRIVRGDRQDIAGQLYSGRVKATIMDHDDDPENFENEDTIDFLITAARGEESLAFQGTRDEFDDFVEHYENTLLEILFPKSLAEGLTGKDAAQNHSQQLLLSRVFERRLRRRQVGGFMEYERFDIDDIDGHAFQGLIYIDRLASALEWRYSGLDDDVGTRSWVVGLDIYPHYTVRSVPVKWSLGGDVFATFLYSRSDAFENGIGAMDFGGGVWSAVHRDFERVRIGTGIVLQASKTHIPSSLISEYAGSDLERFAETINDREVDLNLDYGVVLGILLADPLSLNVRIIENHSFTRTGGRDATSETTFLVTLSYLFYGLAPIDIGYKRAGVGLDGITSNSFVLEGNYRW